MPRRAFASPSSNAVDYKTRGRSAAPLSSLNRNRFIGRHFLAFPCLGSTLWPGKYSGTTLNG